MGRIGIGCVPQDVAREVEAQYGYKHERPPVSRPRGVGHGLQADVAAFAISEALGKISEAVSEVNRYVERRAPWSLVKESHTTEVGLFSTTVPRHCGYCLACYGP